MQNHYLNINARLAEEVLRRGLADEFRVLLALKAVAKGNGAYFLPTPKLKRKLRGLCGWKCQRTATRKLRRLRNLGWIGRDDKGRCYVRSFSYLLNEFDIRSDTVHQICVPFCVESKRKAKATLFSIALGKIIANRHFALVRKNAAHTSTGRGRYSYEPGEGETHGPPDLSVSFLARRFDRSKATIHRWKHLALKENMIDRKKRQFVFPGGSASQLSKAFPDEHIRESFEIGHPVAQLTDQLDCRLAYKSRQQ